MRPPESALAQGPDGRLRCWWGTGDPLYVDYHDREWGRPLHGDEALYGLLTLESFQSGLAWITILRKRDAFRQAFDGFRIDAVAAYGDGDVERLLGDAGIVRNRAKIEAAVANARAARDLPEGLDAFVWSFAPARRARPRSSSEIAATTPESQALAKELRRRGFRFVGPTVAYAFMQAAGLVDDHIQGCETAP